MARKAVHSDGPVGREAPVHIPETLFPGRRHVVHAGAGELERLDGLRVAGRNGRISGGIASVALASIRDAVQLVIDAVYRIYRTVVSLVPRLRTSFVIRAVRI